MKKVDDRAHHIFLSNGAMKEILRIIFEDKKSLPFKTPVDPEDAPDYHEIIECPMDLSTVQMNFRKGLYDDHCENFIRDMKLIWNNCLEYNEADSEIAEAAEALKSRFERLVNDSGSRKKEKDPLEIKMSKKVTEPTVSKNVDKLQDLEFNCGDTIADILKSLKSNEFVVPFLHPVSAKDAPGYYDVVSKPMDVSTVEKKFKNGEYSNEFDCFVADIRQIWSNCKLYNDPQSEIYGWALNCETAFEEKLKKSLKKFKRKYSETQEAPRVTVTNSSNEFDASAMNIEMAEDDLDIEDENPNLNADEKKKRRIYASHRVRMFKSVLKTLFDCESCETFKVPATNPKYYERVEKPIDLSVIKGKIEDYHNFPLSFLADLKLVFDNYIQAFPSDHELHHQATVLKQTAVDTFFRCFPSLQSQKTQNDPKFSVRSELQLEDSVPIVPKIQAKTNLVQNQTSLKSSSDGVRTSNVDPFKLFGDTPSNIKADRTSASQLESTMKQLIDEVDPNKIQCVRQFCQKKAATLLKEIRFPWSFVSGLYEVRDIGKLVTAANSHTANSLFPVGYNCSRTMRLCLIPQESSAENTSSVTPFVPVNISSRIELNGMNVVFKIILQNGTLIAEAADPRSAWQSLIDKELKTLNSIASNLHRCRAVFNRLCVSKDAEPFLEQVPMGDKFASDYYSVITSPMWLREIHSRLNDGTYDNEFDFAWDVRLLFRNCRQYNVKGSSLYKAADKLSLLFDRLFIHWVYNVQDKSVDDAAKGAWDDWFHLKYFDSNDPTENICVLTGEKLEESKLIQCAWCDDQYSFAALELARKPKSGWACPRCQKALEMAGSNNLNDDPFGNFTDALDYTCANFGRDVFLPASDIGEGWFQAKKKNGAGVKNLYLSPLGYEISKDGIIAQKDFEATVDNDLIGAREKEFKEMVSANKTTSASSKRKGRKSKAAVSTNQDEDVAVPLGSKFLEDDGRIVSGKLYNFVVPPHYRIAWFIHSNENQIIEAAQSELDISPLLSARSEMISEEIPALGYFGLDIKEIRSVLEGLENSVDCVAYNFMEAEKSRALLIEEYTTKLQHGAASEEAEAALKKALLKARWCLERQKLFPTCGKIEPNAIGTMKTGFQTISTHNLPSGGMDILMTVWDFLESSQMMIGYTNVTLTELISSVFPPISILPTCGQIIFDELCCLFTDLLFREIQIKYQCWSAIDWQDVLLVNPINTITWPKVCERALLMLSLPWTKSEAKILMHSVLYGEPLIQLKILCLLYNHPLMDTFFGCEPLLRLKSLILSSCFESDAKLATPQFCSQLCDIFVNFQEEYSDPVDKLRSSQLLIWLKSLFCRIGYMSVSLEDSLSAHEMQNLMQNSRRDFGPYTVRNCDDFCDEILSPSAFNVNAETPFAIKMKYLFALERTLSLLSSVDSEGLCVQDRLSIYITLVDHCCSTQKFLLVVQQTYAEHVSKLESLPVEEYQEIMSHNNLQSPQTIPNTAICYFTGIPFKFLPSSSKWAVVPQEFLLEYTCLGHVNKIEEGNTVADGQSLVFALKDVLNRVINCKKLAVRERSSYEVICIH